MSNWDWRKMRWRDRFWALVLLAIIGGYAAIVATRGDPTTGVTYRGDVLGE